MSAHLRIAPVVGPSQDCPLGQSRDGFEYQFAQRRCYSNFSRLFPKILQTDTTCFYSSTRSSEQNWFLSVHWLSNCVPIKSTVASIALETWKSHKILGHQIPWTPNTRDTKYYEHSIQGTPNTRATKYYGHQIL